MKYKRLNFNKNGIRFVLTLLALLTIGTQAHTAVIFLSAVGVVGGGASIADPIISHSTSDTTGELYIWVTDDQKVDQSLSLNIASDNPGVISFTGANVFNPFVNVGVPALSDNRWQGTGGGTVSANGIENIVGVAVTEGLGLLPALATSDPLHDAAANAWLFAQVNYNILGFGTTNLAVSVGPVDIVDAGTSVAGAYSFGKSTVEVVPEPGTSALIAVCALAATLTRTRRQF